MPSYSPNEHVVRELWRLMSDQQFAAVGALLADDFVCDWPLTRERIRGRERYIALNQAYPGAWRITIEELMQSDDLVMTRCRLEWSGRVEYAISFFTMRDGRIAHEVDWWPVPYSPPPGRELWTEPLPPDAIPIT